MRFELSEMIMVVVVTMDTMGQIDIGNLVVAMDSTGIKETYFMESVLDLIQIM